MKARCWHGTGDVRVDTVPDPTIQDPRDIVIKITSTAIQAGAIDPAFVITHRVLLADAPAAYKTFRDKEDGCIKVVLKP